ncbi:MAG: DUF4189 domain-containing protein, partial [Lysobacter sp.]|nr:DUF4189 domain-containing protein [Lysobacter sp.]
RWLDRWGGLASDGQGNWGISKDKTSKKNAISTALNECKLRGGRTCEIRLTYKNQCAAVVADGSATSTASDKTEREAINRATSLCEEDGGPSKCWTYYSGCSFPVKDS